MEEIRKFLSINSDYYNYGDGYDDSYGSGYGDGYGDGSGCDSGCGYGYGDGCGSGYGYGYGYGDGCGSGYDSGCGSGYGDGCGSGDGYGSGYGDGCGNGASEIKALNGEEVYTIDGVSTLIFAVKANVARGAILNIDLTRTKCFIVKRGNLFAHGETLRAAMIALNDKLFESMDINERIDMFIKEFDLDQKYPAMRFFDWHNKLTGSCEMGRKSFVRDHDIDLDHDVFSVSEFVKLTKNDFGSQIIRQLEEKL